jgi:hypothetical protein
LIKKKRRGSGNLRFPDEKIYHTNSIKLRKQKAEEFINHNFGRIGNLMLMQIGGYT